MIVHDTGACGQLDYDAYRILAKSGNKHQSIRLNKIYIFDVCHSDYLSDAVTLCAAYTVLNQAELMKVNCYAINEIVREMFAGGWYAMGKIIILQLAETYGTVNLVTNQIGLPTYATDFALLPWDMNTKGKYGRDINTDESVYSYAEFFEKTICRVERKTDASLILANEYPTPSISRLSRGSLNGAGSACRPSCNGALRRCSKGELL